MLDARQVAVHTCPSRSLKPGNETTQCAKMEKRGLTTALASVPRLHFRLGKQHVKKLLGKYPPKFVARGQEVAEPWSPQSSGLPGC